MVLSVTLWVAISAIGCVPVSRGVTIYGQVPYAFTAGLVTTIPEYSLPTPSPIHAAAIPRPPPTPPIKQALDFTLDLAWHNNSVTRLSIMQQDSFFGLSIPTSAVTQLMGINASTLKVPFLNLLAQIEQRAGGTHIHIGHDMLGFLYLFDDTLGVDSAYQNPPTAPIQPLVNAYPDELFYIAANISSHVDIDWSLGIPFDGDHWLLQIAEKAQQILGDHFVALHAEKKSYYFQREQVEPQKLADLKNDYESLINSIKDYPDFPNNLLIGPSLPLSPFLTEKLWGSAFYESFTSRVKYIAAERYLTHRCSARTSDGALLNPQPIFANSLDHAAAISTIERYQSSIARAQVSGKPLLMFETPTAACGSVPGNSDNFGAALWVVDFGLTMAAANFSGALLRVGERHDYYSNPFTGTEQFVAWLRLNIISEIAPSTNRSSYYQWTVGPTFYSILVVAEIFGKTRTSQIVDTSYNSAKTSSYAVYDQGVLSKVVIINFINDPSGINDITATLTINSSHVQDKVYAKYLKAPSASAKTNITWGGQTFGDEHQADGRLKGDLDITEIECDQTRNECRIPVKAPSLVLVFLKNPLFEGATYTPARTFSTTVMTKTINTATIDPSVLATSNGHSGKDRVTLKGTSAGIKNEARGSSRLIPGTLSLIALVAGAAVVLARFVR